MISTTASLQQLSVKYFLPSIKLSQKRIFPSFFWFKSIKIFLFISKNFKTKIEDSKLLRGREEETIDLVWLHSADIEHLDSSKWFRPRDSRSSSKWASYFYVSSSDRTRRLDTFWPDLEWPPRLDISSSSHLTFHQRWLFLASFADRSHSSSRPLSMDLFFSSKNKN